MVKANKLRSPLSISSRERIENIGAIITLSEDLALR